MLKRIGRYEVQGLLGSGGMGTVYRARMTGPGKASKEVALKLLHAHLCEESRFVEMFLNEMRLAMAMTHRNIVQTFDAGLEDQRYYMVMELVDGCSLRDLLRQLPRGECLPLAMALFVAREIAEALAHAHERDLDLTGQTGGLIHRDVCPNNALLSRQGDVKLADFGIARAATFLDPEARLTIQGKPGYMAPEQARGAPEPRSDLFSLGAVVHELVYGQRLRKGNTMETVRRDVRVPPPARDDLPPALVALIASCTEPDPDRRPASARELVRTFDRMLLDLRSHSTAELDPRGNLGAYLAARIAGPAEDAAPGGGDPRAARVAELLLADPATADVPTTPSAPPVADGPPAAPEAPPAGQPPGATVTMTPGADHAPDAGPADADATPATSYELPPPRRRRLPWPAHPIAIVALSALALGGVGLWLGLRSDGAPADDAPRADGAQPPAGAGGVAARPRRADAGAPTSSPAQTVVPSSPGVDARPPAKRHSRRRHRRRRRSAVLDLNAVPWALVYVDGRRLGETPLQGIRLTPGRHRVRLVNPVLKTSRTLRLRLRPGQRLRKVVVLRR